MDGSSGGLGENKKFNSVSSIGAPINNFDNHQTSTHGGTVLLHGSTKHKAVVNDQVSGGSRARSTLQNPQFSDFSSGGRNIANQFQVHPIV